MMTYSFPVIQGEKTGKRLKDMRKARGIKVAVICEYMGGLSEQAIYKWERGACLPTIDNLLALSHLYNVPMEELLVYEEAEIASYFFGASGDRLKWHFSSHFNLSPLTLFENCVRIKWEISGN